MSDRVYVEGAHGDGDPGSATFAIVGEAPAKEEVRLGRGFVGPSGKVLWPLLERLAGVTREQCYVTNLCKHPLDNDLSGEAKLSAEEFRVCATELLRELRPMTSREGTRILAVGRLAANALLDETRPLEVINGRGFRLGLSRVVPTFHPAAALRPGGEDRLALTGAAISRLANPPMWVGVTPPKLVEWTEMVLERGGMLGVDTEGLPEDPICMTVATLKHRAWVEPKNVRTFWTLMPRDMTIVYHNAIWDWAVLEAMGVSEPWTHSWVDSMEEAYLQATEPKGLKELAYRHFGFRMKTFEEAAAPGWVETVTWAAEGRIEAGTSVETHTPKGKVRKVPKVVLGEEAKSLKRSLGNPQALAKKMGFPGMTIRYADRASMVDYATLDPWMTLMVYEKLTGVTWEAYLHPPAESPMTRMVEILKGVVPAKFLPWGDVVNARFLDLAVWPMFYRMSKVGILVDRERMERLRVDVEEMKDEQLALLHHYTGEDINPNSGPQVAAWLEKEGLGTKLTKSKSRMATDERSLSAYGSNPVVGCILDYRGLDKLRAAFIEPTLEKSKVDGCVHPKWRLTKVKSGRVACEDPNLLAFPSRDEMGKKVRDCFVARPDRTMFSVDFAQIEPRTVAMMSRDPGLVEIYASGRDLYTETAVKLFRLAGAEKVEKVRHRLPAKVVTLGVLYGIGAAKLYEELIRWGAFDKDGVPFFDVEGCEGLIRRWFEIYPGVRELVGRVCAQARKSDGWVYTQGGRGRYLPALFLLGSRWPEAKLREEAERQAFNHLIQGTAQEIMKEAMLRADGASKLWTPLLQIHDELVGEVPTMALRTVETVRRAMEVECGYWPETKIHFATTASTSHCWGGLK